MKLKPFDIGGVRIDVPVVLAALAGYSDAAYRLICRRFGAPYCTTEMMLDRFLLAPGKMRTRLVGLGEGDHPIAGQLLGNDPAVMAEAAGVLCRTGFDVVDLNFACPVNKALRRRRGGYLMREPEQAIGIVRAVLAAADRPVTLKLRRSFSEDDGGCDAFWRIAEAGFDAGVAAVCVHARSVEVKYAGDADWEFIASVKARFADRTIIGSGDVLTPADALRMLAETRADAVSAARGVLGNPWFFRQVLDLAEGRPSYRPPIAEQRQVLEDHFARACDIYGPRRGPKNMRKFGIKYARMHTRPRVVRAAFIEVKHAADWQAVMETFYTDEYDAPDTRPAGRTLKNEGKP